MQRHAHRLARGVDERRAVERAVSPVEAPGRLRAARVGLDRVARVRDPRPGELRRVEQVELILELPGGEQPPAVRGPMQRRVTRELDQLALEFPLEREFDAAVQARVGAEQIAYSLLLD